MRYLIISVLMWSYPMCAQCRSVHRDLLLVCQGRLVLVARQANLSRVAWQPAVCFMLITKLTIIIDTTRNWKYLKKVDLVWCTLPSRQSGWSGWWRIMKGLLPECCLCNEEARRTNNGLTPALSAPCMASYLTCVTRYLMYSDISRQRPSVSGAVCWL